MYGECRSILNKVLILLQYKMDAILDLILKAYVPWSSAMEDLVNEGLAMTHTRSVLFLLISLFGAFFLLLLWLFPLSGVMLLDKISGQIQQFSISCCREMCHVFAQQHL